MKEEKKISTRSTPIPAVYADPRFTLSMTATEYAMERMGIIRQST
jgi:hypothetical protein